MTGYDDGNTSAVYEYDALGRRTAETVNYGTFSLSYGYSYDAAGRKTTFTAPDGSTTSYTYNAGGQLETISPAGSGTLTLGDYQWNSPTRMGLPGGNSQLRAYDGLMRLTGITALDPADNPVLNYQYDRDAVNNILARTTEHGSYQYDYDDLDRLTAADNPTLADEQYSYDPVGNRLTSSNTSNAWQYNDSDELLAYNDTDLEYDANGSLITKTVGGAVTHYEYTLDNRLSRVYKDDGSLEVRYGYDPFGRRLWKEIDGTRTYYLYAEEGLIAEANGSGTVTRQYGWRPDGLWGTDPLYLKTGGQSYYYHNDHLGTPQKLVSVTGQVVWEARYAAFGAAQAAGTIENPLRFPGQYYDVETGMHYNYFRYYDSDISRYVKVDLFGIEAGINTYVYAKNNPLSYIDNLGLFCVYEQSTGDYACYDSSGNEYTNGNGYSGAYFPDINFDFRNKPEYEHFSDMGVIPKGCYKISKDGRTTKGRRDLIPLPGTDTHGRHSFQIHGDYKSSDSRSGKGVASSGCIIINKIKRNQIKDGEVMCVH